MTVAWMSLSLSAITFLEPDSVRWHIINDSGISGGVVKYALAVIAVITLIDVLVNDMLSDRYSLQITQTARMYLYMTQAILNMAVIGAAAKAGAYSWVLTSYAVLSLASVWIAVFDVWHRHLLPKMQRL